MRREPLIPCEVIRLMVNLLLAPDSHVLTLDGIINCCLGDAAPGWE